MTRLDAGIGLLQPAQLRLPSGLRVASPPWLVPSASPSPRYIHMTCSSANTNSGSGSGSGSGSSSSSRRKAWNPDPSVDTRIHWSSEDEGWLGESAPSQPHDAASLSGARSFVLDNLLANLVAQIRDSHYEFLEVPPTADSEQIKAAYRRLSKLYHPDTTSLPLDLAAQKFIRLQKAYAILNNVEERRFYDWSLAQQASRQQGGRFIWPYEADRTQRGPGSETVTASKPEEDSYGGPYYDLSPQIITALMFDAFALVMCIICITFVVVFKQ